MEAGQYQTDCKAIAESQRLDPRSGTLFTLARCERLWGHVATAVTHYRDYLWLFERMTESEQARQNELHRPEEARAQRDLLSAEVPELMRSLPPDAPIGTMVKRDDVVVSSAMLGVALPLDPGEHVVSTQAPGGPVWEQRFTIALKEKKQMGLAFVSTLGFVLGLAGVGTALVLRWTEPPKREPARGAGGTWLSVGVLSVSPGGAMAGARGAW